MNTTACASFTQDGYREAITGTIRAVFGERRNAAKILACKTGASPRTAENWLAGTCAPRGAELIKLMAHSTELRAEVDRLIQQLQEQA